MVSDGCAGCGALVISSSSGRFFLAMWLLGERAQLGINYWAGLAVAAGFTAWLFAIGRSRQPEACFRAFLANQWVGLAVFAGIALELALR